MTTHELLVAARNSIAEGWVQHSLETPEGMCARGGLICVGKQMAKVEGKDAARAAVVEAEKVLVTFIPPQQGEALLVAPERWVEMYGEEWAAAARRIVKFNNAPERTKEEVLAVFDEAICLTAPEPADPFPSEQMVEVSA